MYRPDAGRRLDDDEDETSELRLLLDDEVSDEEADEDPSGELEDGDSERDELEVSCNELCDDELSLAAAEDKMPELVLSADEDNGDDGWAEPLPSEMDELLDELASSGSGGSGSTCGPPPPSSSTHGCGAHTGAQPGYGG